ncbi:MAG: T9SS type A sorting domain-containing protein [Candidatus Edwardsbacteria bacterium]
MYPSRCKRFGEYYYRQQGGGVIAWYDLRNSAVTKGDIYAQRVDSAGNVLWQLNGVPVCTVAQTQEQVAIASDESGGAIMAWYDVRGVEGVQGKIYAQKIDSTGTSQWTLNGVAVCTADSPRAAPCLVSDGLGGAIISWIDMRDWENDIYAQWLDSLGNPQWIIDGIPVCVAPGSQNNDWYNRSNHIISDGKGGAIVVWHDTRSGVDVDIYAQRLRGPENGITESISASEFQRNNKLMIRPNPFKHYTEIHNLKVGSEIKIYNILGQLVEKSKNRIVGKNLSSGIYLLIAESYKPIKIVKLK